MYVPNDDDIDDEGHELNAERRLMYDFPSIPQKLGDGLQFLQVPTKSRLARSVTHHLDCFKSAGGHLEHFSMEACDSSLFDPSVRFSKFF